MQSHLRCFVVNSWPSVISYLRNYLSFHVITIVSCLWTTEIFHYSDHCRNDGCKKYKYIFSKLNVVHGGVCWIAGLRCCDPRVSGTGMNYNRCVLWWLWWVLVRMVVPSGHAIRAAIAQIKKKVDLDRCVYWMVEMWVCCWYEAERGPGWLAGDCREIVEGVYVWVWGR